MASEDRDAVDEALQAESERAGLGLGGFDGDELKSLAGGDRIDGEDLLATLTALENAIRVQPARG